MIVKQLSPGHDQELGDICEPEYMTFSDNMGEYDTNRMYSHQQVHQTSMTDINNYDGASFTPLSQISDCTNIPNSRKSLLTGCHNSSDSYENRHPNLWNHANLIQWISRVCELHKLDYQKLRFSLDSLDGSMLVQMSKAQLQEKFPHGGAYFYDELQKFLNEFVSTEDTLGYSIGYSQPIGQPDFNWDVDTLSYNQSNNHCNLSFLNSVHHSINQNNNNQLTTISSEGYGLTSQRNEYVFHSTPMMEHHEIELKSPMDSEGESNHSFNTYTYNQDNYIMQSESNSKIPGRRKPGRPPSINKTKGKNGGQRNSRLWEFIRDLLLDAKTCPSLLKWENVDEGVFRFVNSEKVARLWGERKCNPRMTYEKLSRAMRYYYKSQVFQPVIGRRLVYKFGPNATGWRPDPSLVS